MPPVSDTADGRPLRLELSPEEVDVLLRACARYRGSLPGYLKSSAEHLRILEAVVGKLQAASGENPR